MKQLNVLSLISVLIIAFNFNSIGQITLPEVKVVSLNYKYLRSVDDTAAAQPVRLLEHKVANYDIKNSDLYDEDFEEYYVSFFIPDGEILAFYNKEGKIYRTAERFKNIALPKPVRESIAQKYPQWSIHKDVYLVQYFPEVKDTKKIYRIVIENGNKKVRLRSTEAGELLN